MGGYCAAVVVDAAGIAAMGAADVLVLVLVLVAFDVVAPLVRLPVVEEVLLVIPWIRHAKSRYRHEMSSLLRGL